MLPIRNHAQEASGLKWNTNWQQMIISNNVNMRYDWPFRAFGDITPFVINHKSVCTSIKEKVRESVIMNFGAIISIYDYTISFTYDNQ